MKSTTVVILLLSFNFVHGQTSINTDYNRSTYSSNVGLLVSKQFNSHQLSFGLRINDPKSSTEPLENIDVHPTNFKESLGLKFNYRYFFKTSLKVKPYIMFSSEYSHSPLRSDYLSEFDRDKVIDPNDNFDYYVGFVHLTGLYHIFDERIGFGFTADVSDRITFTIYGGSGVTWMNYDKGNVIVILPGPAVNHFFGLGIGYTFK